MFRKVVLAMSAAATAGALAAAAGCRAQTASSTSTVNGATQIAQLSKSLAAASRRSDNVPTAAEESTRIRFQDADCKHLTETDVERYVDPRIVGAVRRIAIRYMLAEPPCARTNVEGIDTVPYSNVWDGLVEVSKEYNAWHRLRDGRYQDSSGDTITPSNP
jgi:hypothetical protein